MLPPLRSSHWAAVAGTGVPSSAAAASAATSAEQAAPSTAAAQTGTRSAARRSRQSPGRSRSSTWHATAACSALASPRTSAMARGAPVAAFSAALPTAMSSRTRTRPCPRRRASTAHSTATPAAGQTSASGVEAVTVARPSRTEPA
jgi:hypothetical protein